MDHTVTLKTSHLVFVARILNIIFSTGQFGFGLTLCVWGGDSWDDYYYYYGNIEDLWAMVPVMTIGLSLMLTSSIGMFAYKRPNDVHWHLMLTLDWLSFCASLAATILAILGIFFNYGSTLPVVVMLVIFEVGFLFTILVPIIRTHRLKKHKLLPPPNSPKETWYHMDQEQAHQSPYANYDAPPPAPVQQSFRRQHSRPDTMARWSGASDTNTTVLDTGVPPYEGPTSPRMSLRKETK